MSTTFEKLSSNQVKLNFKADAQTFEKGMKAAYNKLKNRVSIPGFRKGHAPRKVIEMHYGESVFYDEAFDAIFPELYMAAIEEHKIDPVDRPSIDIKDISAKDGVEFECTVYVRPEVELGNYKGLVAEKQVVDVSDDDVSAELERARERVARFVDVTDRAVKLDDQVEIDYKGFVGDNQFEGGTADGAKLTIGSGTFIPGFEDQLIGATIGQELDVNVTFPEEYHAEDLAGKEAVFKVKVNAIQEKEMPDLDDEFAKDVSEFDTLAEYKDDILDRLTKDAQQKADIAFENELIEAVCENAKVDIPEAMIEDQLNSMIRDMETRMRYQGLNMQDFLKYTGQTEQQMRDTYKPEAEERVRTQLVLQAVKEKEGMTATEEEIDQEMQRYADSTKKSLEEFKATLSDNDKEYFADAAAMRKTIEMIKDSAVSE